MQCYFIYSKISLSVDPTKDVWNVGKLAKKAWLLARAQCPIIQVWPSGRITLIGDVTPGQETRAGNFFFLPCLSNNMRIRGHNFLTQIFLTGSCYTKNILRHVGILLESKLSHWFFCRENVKIFHLSLTLPGKKQTTTTFNRTPPPPPGQQLLAKLGKMWWVVSQIWLNSDSNELSQSWVRLANLGFELSRCWVNQEK